MWLANCIFPSAKRFFVFMKTIIYENAKKFAHNNTCMFAAFRYLLHITCHLVFTNTMSFPIMIIMLINALSLLSWWITWINSERLYNLYAKRVKVAEWNEWSNEWAAKSPHASLFLQAGHRRNNFFWKWTEIKKTKQSASGEYLIFILKCKYNLQQTHEGQRAWHAKHCTADRHKY